MTDKGMQRLASELRDWTTRPTRLSATAARTRVLAHLPGRTGRAVGWFVGGGAALAAGTLALVLIAGALLIGRREPPVAAGPALPAQTQQRMIVHQLSTGTKLYIVVQPSAGVDES